MDANRRKMTRRIIQVKYFTAVQSWKDLAITVRLRYTKVIEVVL